MIGRAEAPVDFKDSLVAASISGGKDSAAMPLWLTEQGLEYRRVFDRAILKAVAP